MITSSSYRRRIGVIVETLQRAGGRCERCGYPAPFLKDSDGSPYLEVHHKTPLAEDGDDTIENAIALCPNCHRHAHYGKQTFTFW
ncbi:MAG TPA: HNH endonuclease signature motif containing protein [Pseudomonadota bacterium]|nr:HNH endonuclease signature motif containing protein [Pseudomonadota bacterium]